MTSRALSFYNFGTENNAGDTPAGGEELAIDDACDIEFLRQSPERRHRAMRAGVQAESIGRTGGVQAGQKVISLAQVGDRDRARFSIDAARLDDVPVGVPPYFACLQACHMLLYTT